LFALPFAALLGMAVAGLAAAQPAPAAPPAAQPTPPVAAPAAPAPDAEVEPAVAAMIASAGSESDRWLDLLDHGKFDDSWLSAAVVLQETVPQKEWSAELAARQPKLGRLIMRERKTGQYSKTLRGAPTGDYVTVTYLTKYEKIPLVVETMAVARDALGQWHVAGYDIALAPAPSP
jgi:outer membrane receptor protein involved in Fe transport